MTARDIKWIDAKLRQKPEDGPAIDWIDRKLAQPSLDAVFDWMYERANEKPSPKPMTSRDVLLARQEQAGRPPQLESPLARMGREREELSRAPADIAEAYAHEFGRPAAEFKESGHDVYWTAIQRGRQEAAQFEWTAERFLEAGENPRLAQQIASEIPEHGRRDFMEVLQRKAAELGEKKRNVEGKLAQRFQRGAGRSDANIKTMLTQAMGLGRPDEQARDEFERTIADSRRGHDPATGESWVGEGALAAAEMAPQMLESGGVALAAGPAGGTAYWFGQIFPERYREFRRDGFDERKSRAAAAVSAGLEAPIEMLQVMQLLPKSLRKGAKRIVGETLKKFLLRYTVKGVKTYGKELGEEIGQEFINLGATGVLDYFDKNTDIDWAQQRGQSIKEIMQAAAAIPFLMGPGHMVGGIREYQAGGDYRTPKGGVLTPEAAGAFAELLPGAAEKLRATKGVPSRKQFEDVSEAFGVSRMKSGERNRFKTLVGEAIDAQSAAQKVSEAGPQPGVVGGKVSGVRVRDASESDGAAETAAEQQEVGVADILLDGAAGIGREINQGAKAAAVLTRRLFTKEGGLPSVAYQAKVARDSAVNAIAKSLVFDMRDFDRAAKDAYGTKKLTEEQTLGLNAVLHSEADPGTTPEAMRPILYRMRLGVDKLSRRLIELGVVPDDMTISVGRKGKYVTRTYRIFGDRAGQLRHLKKHPEIQNKVEALIRQEFPGYADEQVAGEVQGLLQNPQDWKDVSILKHRKEIPSEIRALWGEVQDPRVNYVRTVSKQAQRVAAHQFLTTVREAGLGKFLFEQRVSNEKGDFVAPLFRRESEHVRVTPAKEKGELLPGFQEEAEMFEQVADRRAFGPFAPLEGLYTTPEIKSALERLLVEQNHQPDWLRIYMKANSGVKFAKTVASQMTQTRNVLGNVGFAVAAGHWRVWKMHKAFKAVMTDLGVKDDAEMRKYVAEGIKYGVFHDTARAGELKAMAQDVAKGDMEEFLLRAAAIGPIKKTAVIATALYRAGDDIWKAYAWENEIARYRRALPDLSLEEIKQLTAGIVRNTYPTYSAVPEAIRALRGFPAFGMFVSFPWEVGRTSYHNIRIMSEEIRDSRLNEIGTTRLAGLMAAAVGTAGIAAATRYLTGTTRDDEEDKRRFFPHWSKNSQIAHLGNTDRLHQSYVDLSYSDPHQSLRKPIIAFLRGEDWEAKILDSAAEAMAPFLGEELLLGKLADVRSNAKPGGGRVYNPQAPFLQRLSDVIVHVGAAWEFGIIHSYHNVMKGVTGKVEKGRAYDTYDELAAVFLGQRRVTQDVPNHLLWNASRFQRNISDATAVMSQVAARSGKVSDTELTKAHAAMERSRLHLHTELQRDCEAAQRLGMTREEAIAALRNGGVSKDVTERVLNGEYAPYMPGHSFLLRARKRPTVEGGADKAAYEHRKRLVRDLAFKAYPTEQARSKALEGYHTALVRRATEPSAESADITASLAELKRRNVSYDDARKLLQQHMQEQVDREAQKQGKARGRRVTAANKAYASRVRRLRRAW